MATSAATHIAREIRLAQKAAAAGEVTHMEFALETALDWADSVDADTLSTAEKQANDIRKVGYEKGIGTELARTEAEAQKGNEHEMESAMAMVETIFEAIQHSTEQRSMTKRSEMQAQAGLRKTPVAA